MRNLLIKILPITIGLLLNQVQGCKSSYPWVWYTKVKNRDSALSKEKEEIKAKEKEHSQTLIDECEQKIVN